MFICCLRRIGSRRARYVVVGLGKLFTRVCLCHSNLLYSPEMEWGLRITGQRFWPGWVGSRVSVSDAVFDMVLSFNMRV